MLEPVLAPLALVQCCAPPAMPRQICLVGRPSEILTISPTSKLVARPPGMTSVPIHFSRVVRARELHSRISPANQPKPKMNPPNRDLPALRGNRVRAARCERRRIHLEQSRNQRAGRADLVLRKSVGGQTKRPSLLGLHNKVVHPASRSRQVRPRRLPPPGSHQRAQSAVPRMSNRSACRWRRA